MSAIRAFTFKKEERLCSKTLIDRLFNGGKSHSLAAFPLRVVYMEQDNYGEKPQIQVLISVPKRCFKLAVKRNRVKRQIREAYRLQKHMLLDTLKKKPNSMMILAFIWLDTQLYASEEVHKKVGNLLERIREKV
jgi:ribonuclease P protein component